MKPITASRVLLSTLLALCVMQAVSAGQPADDLQHNGGLPAVQAGDSHGAEKAGVLSTIDVESQGAATHHRGANIINSKDRPTAAPSGQLVPKQTARIAQMPLSILQQGSLATADGVVQAAEYFAMEAPPALASAAFRMSISNASVTEAQWPHPMPWRTEAADKKKPATLNINRAGTGSNDITTQALNQSQSWPQFDNLGVGGCLISENGVESCMRSPSGVSELCIYPDGDILLWVYTSTKDHPEGSWVYTRLTDDEQISLVSGRLAVWLCLSLVDVRAFEYDYEANPRNSGIKKPYWSQALVKSVPWRLYLQDDGVVVAMNRACEPIWSFSGGQCQGTCTPVLTSQCWPVSGVKNVTAGNRIWELFMDPRNFTDAQAWCQSRDKNLVTIRSPEEHNLYVQAFAGLYTGIWVGLRTKGPDFSYNRSDWMWISTNGTAYDGWDTYEPISWGLPEPSACAAAWLRYGGRFWATQCSWELPFACEPAPGCAAPKYLDTTKAVILYNVDLSAPCRSPYTGNATVRCQADGSLTVIQGGCETRIQVENKTIAHVVQWATQRDARAACQQRGGELLAVEDDVERSAVIRAQKGVSDAAWIGLTARNGLASTTKSNFLWLSSGKAPSNDWWAVGQPSGGAGEVCVEQRIGANLQGIGWNDQLCNATRPFVCQIGCSAANLTAADNAVWEASCDATQSGRSCVASCVKNWMPSPVGAPSAACNGSTWTAPKGSCVPLAATCPGQPVDRPNARWACGVTGANGVCTATCAVGTVGPVTSTCKASGAPRPSWDTPVGVCTAVVCQGSPVVTNANFSCGTTSNFGRTCVGSCNGGFVSSTGSINATCSDKGLWIVAGSCNKGCTMQPQAVPNATFTCPLITAVGQTCNAVCRNGTVGNVFATCKGGTFDWSVAEAPRCATACTGSPEARPNSKFSCASITQVNGVCRATCANGYNGTVKATCQQSGQWGTTRGRCTPMMCNGNPTPDPQYGRFSCGRRSRSGKTSPVGSVCTAQCNATLPAAGAPTAVCLADGTWSRVVGKCTLICGPSPTTGRGSPCEGLADSNGTCIAVQPTVAGGEGSYECGCDEGYFWSRSGMSCQPIGCLVTIGRNYRSGSGGPTTNNDASQIYLLEVRLFNKSGHSITNILYSYQHTNYNDSNGVLHPASNCVDGNRTTYCRTADNDDDPYLGVEYSCSEGLSRVEVINNEESSYEGDLVEGGFQMRATENEKDLVAPFKFKYVQASYTWVLGN